MKMCILKLLTLILSIITLSCYWQEFKLSNAFLAKFRERNDSYSYENYKIFKEELKILANWRLSLIDDMAKAKAERDKLYSKIRNDIEKIKHTRKEINESGEPSEETLKKENYVYKRFEDLKTALNMLIEVNKKEKVSLNDFLTRGNFIGPGAADLTDMFYFSIYRLIMYKLRFIDVKKYYEKFDENFLRRAITRGVKIFVYHFPLLYEDLAFLFEAEYDYFK